MKIVLTDKAQIDGLEFDKGSRLDLDPVFATSLIERKKAIPDQEILEKPEKPVARAEKAVRFRDGKKG